MGSMPMEKVPPPTSLELASIPSTSMSSGPSEF